MTYRIVRNYFAHGAVILRRGVSLEEAQEHCRNPETSSATATGPLARNHSVEFGAWFDGYEEETP